MVMDYIYSIYVKGYQVTKIINKFYKKIKCPKKMKTLQNYAKLVGKNGNLVTFGNLS